MSPPQCATVSTSVRAHLLCLPTLRSDRHQRFDGRIVPRHQRLLSPPDLYPRQQPIDRGRTDCQHLPSHLLFQLHQMPHPQRQHPRHPLAARLLHLPPAVGQNLHHSRPIALGRITATEARHRRAASPAEPSSRTCAPIHSPRRTRPAARSALASQSCARSDFALGGCIQ